MNIRIRNAILEDRQRTIPLQLEIAQLHHQARPDLMKNEARLFTEESFRARLDDPNHTVLIAETEDGTVVGYAFAFYESCGMRERTKKMELRLEE